MFFSSTLGVSLAVVALSTLVTGDPTTVVTMKSLKVTKNLNDYFDDWTFDIIKGKKSSLLSVKVPTKKDLPDTMAVKFVLKPGDDDPIEYTSSVCDAMQEDLIGKPLGLAGMPKDKYPKECPYTAGDWSVYQWDPPSDKIPPGFPEGIITGYMQLLEEGKEPSIQIDFEAEISHASLLGR